MPPQKNNKRRLSPIASDFGAPSEAPKPLPRKPRADAQRNRARILEIAKEAAVHRTEVENLATAESEFAESMPPVQALRAWMLLYVDYIATKQIIAPALNTIVGGPSKLLETTGAQIKGAINALVGRASESGDIRPDFDPLDLLRALIGVSDVASGPDRARTAKKLVDMLILASRPVA